MNTCRMMDYQMNSQAIRRVNIEKEISDAQEYMTSVNLPTPVKKGATVSKKKYSRMAAGRFTEYIIN